MTPSSAECATCQCLTAAVDTAEAPRPGTKVSGRYCQRPAACDVLSRTVDTQLDCVHTLCPVLSSSYRTEASHNPHTWTTRRSVLCHYNLRDRNEHCVVIQLLTCTYSLRDQASCSSQDREAGSPVEDPLPVDLQS